MRTLPQISPVVRRCSMMRKLRRYWDYSSPLAAVPGPLIASADCKRLQEPTSIAQHRARARAIAAIVGTKPPFPFRLRFCDPIESLRSRFCHAEANFPNELFKLRYCRRLVSSKLACDEAGERGKQTDANRHHQTRYEATFGCDRIAITVSHSGNGYERPPQRIHRGFDVGFGNCFKVQHRNCAEKHEHTRHCNDSGHRCGLPLLEQV